MKMEGTKKLIVGLFVAACMLLFGVGLFLIGNSNQLFTKSFSVHADFAKITGIQNGGKVRVAGMDAGTITRIEVPSQPGGKFRLHFRIVENLHPIVRQDSVATIQTDGLLGNKFLEVDAGSAESQLAASNSAISSKEPFDWGDLMDEINGVVKQVNELMAGIKDQILSTLTQIEGTVKRANSMIDEANPHIQGLLASANKITANLNEIVDGVQAGKGTVGALFKDEALYASVRRSAEKTEKAIGDIREVSASAKRIVSKVEDSDIVPEIQKTMENMRRITLRLKEAVEKFQPESGEAGVSDNFKQILADAHVAMSDLSDDTEALKHNFLFRSFFNKRGFFELEGITSSAYKHPSFGKGFKKHRIWLESAKLFSTDAKGVESLSAEGKARLDEAMTEVLTFPRNGPLMVEGFALAGPASQQYLTGRSRAVRVRAYVVERFHLRANYVGAISLGSEQGKDGVAIVSFYK